MGRMKDGVDSTFGEAVIEVRGVKNVGAHFLKVARLSGMMGVFLVNPENILDHSVAIFDFLDNFGSFDLKTSDFFITSAICRF